LYAAFDATQHILAQHFEREDSMPPILEGYLSEQETAAAIHKTPRTLQSWRQQGVGPAYIKIGKTVFYEHAALLIWLKALQTQPVRNRRRPAA
jgi:hypothetical protein